MPGNKKGGNQQPNKNNQQQQQQKGGEDFKFDFNAEGKPAISKEAQTALMPVLQQRLDKLIGVDSGYLDTLPQSVQKRIKALNKIQDKHDSLEEDFRKEMDALEKKYDALKNPLYSRRAEIVQGKSEPTTEELAGGEDKKDAKTEAKDDIKGIPEFWLTALRHHPAIETMIQPHDEPILKHITDIRVVYPDPDVVETFAVEFDFAPNDYFDNKTLNKTFKMSVTPEGAVLENVTSSSINWKQGKNVTVKQVQKRQGGGGGKRGGKGGRGGKQGGQGKVVTVEEDVESFFHFFDEIDLADIDDEDVAEEILESDYDLGQVFQTNIVADAVRWFTGEAETYGMGEGESGDEDDDEMDDEEDDDEEESAPKAKKGGKKGKSTNDMLNDEYDSEEDKEDYDPKTDPKAAAQPECKQQ